MTRFKWYRLSLPIAASNFLRKLRLASFAPSNDWGFISVEGLDDRSSFQFVWRSDVFALGIDDQGNTTRQTISSVDRLACSFFEVGTDFLLRVDDPPRTLRDLFNALEATAGFGFAAEPVQFSQKQQSKFLARFDETRLVGLKGVGGSPEPKLVARIEVASKEGLQPERLKFLEGLQFAIDHASYEVTQSRLKGQVTFTASGAVRVSGSLQPFIVSQLEKQLTQARS